MCIQNLFSALTTFFGCAYNNIITGIIYTGNF